MPNLSPQFTSLFTPRQIACHLTESTCQQASRRLLELISAGDDSLDVSATYQLIEQRDRCAVLLVLPDVAVIHASVRTVPQLRIALGTSRGGLSCVGAQDRTACPESGSHTIGLVALMLSPVNDPLSYLLGSAVLGDVCRQQGFLSQLLAFQDSASVWKWFDDAGQHLPEYVMAHHIMDSDYPRLRSTNTLSEVIDAFCYFGVGELPVVDEDGDMLGVVREDELLKIGLPEYITWMEDLSPILKFEPFVEILRREAKVPVFEVMGFAERYATIDEKSPAIQATKLMIRRDVRQVYVMRGKRLAGVISVRNFIRQILRA